ncbi:hypothetical protein PInf_012827 [Phytophthora infestans]|nr:hypothetical protein PInf_012827 [Phytophthora infestans]
MEEVSWRDLMDMSYEAGGVYPTIVGYALGTITALFFSRCSSWISRLVPAALCPMFLLHIFYNHEAKPFKWMLLIAAGTGIGCTYVQKASMDLIRDHFAFKRVVGKANKREKHD